MFGLKWLWKTNRGSNIDTSNFVSKEFLNTTLQDYVNRDLLNTTLSNELANYVSTTTLNNTLNNYVLNSSLNTTLSSYVQTNTLNTTLQNYVQTTTLNNYVSTNTAQTITGAKTFTEGVIINKNPVPLTLKATDNNKTYIVYKDSSNNSNFSLGANSGQTSLEVNRGDLLIQTQQNNKTVSFETGVIKTNRARVEFGTEINAGYGGATVKFIPEDNSTKTLQFYNSAATDTRRFNLLVPEPTAAQNPATKNYVDNAIAGVSNVNLESQINTLNTFKTSVENSIGYHIRVQELDLDDDNGLIATTETANSIIYTYKITSVNEYQILSANLRGNFQSVPDSSMINVVFSFATVGNNIYFNIIRLDKNSNAGFPFRPNCFIRIFYVDNLTSRIDNPFYFEGGN